MQVSLTVNHEEKRLDVDPRELLLDVLRDRLELTGAKHGCGAGNCGACTVLLNGEAVYACLVLGAECDGDTVTTVEGLERNGELDAVQQAFVEHDAMQCGFCTPGQIMNVTSLRSQPPELTDERLKLELSGNLCRCGTYPNILRAARAVLDRRSSDNDDG